MIGTASSLNALTKHLMNHVLIAFDCRVRHRRSQNRNAAGWSLAVSSIVPTPCCMSAVVGCASSCASTLRSHIKEKVFASRRRNQRLKRMRTRMGTMIACMTCNLEASDGSSGSCPSSPYNAPVTCSATEGRKGNKNSVQLVCWQINTCVQCPLGQPSIFRNVKQLNSRDNVNIQI